MDLRINRRQLLAQAGVTAAAGLSVPAVRAAPRRSPRAADDVQEPFAYCLNTSTIRSQDLSLVAKIEIAAQAGYQAIEPWIREIRTAVDGGVTVKDLKKRIADAGLSVASAIGFAEWIVDDEQRRAQGLETARRDMELVRDIGGTRIAAPPAGATRQTDLDLWKAAERYGELLKLGQQIGVTPQLEVWGFSASLSRLGEVVLVAVESGHEQACVLPDVYHIYKGGSDFAGLRLIDGGAIHVFHMNDYPADPPRAMISDSHRVYPGDGVAPLNTILSGLYDTGFRGTLSLELFNREYWQQDAAAVARTGLEKMCAAVQRALA